MMGSRARRSALLIGVLGLLLAAGVLAATRHQARTPHSPACIPPAYRLFGPPQAFAKEISTPLRASVLSSFAILRRPGGPSDQIPGAQSGVELGTALLKEYELSGYYPTYVRELARLPGGARYFLIPAFGRPEAVPPVGCFRAALLQEMREEERRRRLEPVYCLVAIDDAGKRELPGCEPFAAVQEGGRIFESSSLTREAFVDLAPDGVAAIRISYREEPAILAPVSRNELTFIPPPPTPRLRAALAQFGAGVRNLSQSRQRRLTEYYNKIFYETEPLRLEWLDSAGRVLRRIDAPNGRPRTAVGNLRAPVEGG